MSQPDGVTEANWRARVERELGEEPFEDLCTETVEGIYLEPLYCEAAAEQAYPGMAPFVRGGRAPGAAAAWERCQHFEDPDPQVVAAQIGDDTANGVDTVWVRLDRAARLGLEATDEAADEHAGIDGVVVADAAGLESLLTAAPARTGLSLDAGANALPLAAVVLAAVRRRGDDPAALRLRFNADPLGALARDGRLPAPWRQLAAEAALLARYCAARLPRARALTISVAPHARCGADAVQQIAVAAATTAEMLRALEASGLEPAVAAAQMTLSFEADRDLLTTLCKLRAARWVWGKVAAASGAGAAAPFVHVASGWRTLTSADPWVNMLRVSEQTTAAILGAADSITCSAFDEPLGRSDARGRRVARNTAAILGRESHLGVVADPVGGAYAVESFTEELARGAWELLREIDAIGLAESLLQGNLQHALDEVWARRFYRLVERRDPVLGVSHFPSHEAAPVRDQPDRAVVLVAARARLESRPTTPGAMLDAVRDRATTATVDNGEQLVETMIEAAEAGATIAELSRALRGEIVGERIEPLVGRRDEEALEELTDTEGDG